jgi:hypothetical protein
MRDKMIDMSVLTTSVFLCRAQAKQRAVSRAGSVAARRSDRLTLVPVLVADSDVVTTPETPYPSRDCRMYNLLT